MNHKDQLDMLNDTFDELVRQEYIEYLQEMELNPSDLLFDIYYAGATTGLCFVKEWNENVRRKKC
jgi:hypothetical protein